MTYAALRGKPARALCSGAIVMLILASSAEAASSKATFSFLLVPEQHWNDRRPNADKALPTGTIFLYEGGSYEPELVLAANEPHELPSGNWLGPAKVTVS